MQHKSHRPAGSRVALCFLLVAASPGFTTAAERGQVDEFRPYFEAGIGHDSNVFRVDDKVSPLADISDDSYWTAEAGFDSRLARGNQVLRAHALVYHDDYSDLDDVDFTGGDGKLTWDWGVGQLWSGSVDYEYIRELRDFANQRVPRVDVKTSNIFSGAVERRLSNRMRLGANADYADIGFSEGSRLDLRRTGAGMSLAFDSSAGNTVSLDADYTKRKTDGVGGTDHTELLVGPVVDWNLTDKSRIQATLRYTNRNENNPLLRDYSGLTGRITGQWSSSARKRLAVSAWREVSSLGDQIANFALVTGINVRPTFSVGERASVEMMIGYESREFQGDPDAFLPPGVDISRRDDDVLTGALRVGWKLTDRIELLLDYNAQSRDSTRLGQDYDYHRVQMGFRASL